MINTDKLKGKIDENNLTVEELEDIIEMDRNALYQKMINISETFTIKEAVLISNALKLTHNEINEIFFREHDTCEREVIEDIILPERITVKRAAELTGLSELSIRLGLQCKHFNFGTAIKTSKKRTVYHISPALLAQYLGLTIEQVKGR